MFPPRVFRRARKISSMGSQSYKTMAYVVDGKVHRSLVHIWVTSLDLENPESFPTALQ